MNTLVAAGRTLHMANRRDGNSWRHAWDLTLALIEREVKVQYKATTVGVAWAVAGPLLQLCVYTFLFSRVLSLGIAHYPSFVFAGILAWSWFQTSINQSSTCITAQPELVRQPTFRPSVLPVVTVGTAFINYLLALPLVFVAAWWDGLDVGANALWLPLLWSVQFGFTAGIAFWVAALNVVFRDTQRIVQVVLQLALFLTPVFYAAESAPPRWSFVFALNPMSIFIGAYRDVLYFDRTPTALPLMALAFVSVASCVTGRCYFERMRGRFVEET